jgi:DNA-binding MarR family transcriptional regulator
MDDAHLIASAGGRLIAAGIRQRGALAQCLGLATTDVVALDHVVTAPGTAPSHLARVLLVSPSGATGVIDRLDNAGLITRVAVAGRHRVGLEATDAGREVHAQALAPLSPDLESLVQELSRRNRLVFAELLTRIADLAERDADELIARAQADARARSAIEAPVQWG